MNLFVANLNPRTKPSDLTDLFSMYGNLESVKVIMDRQTGRSKRYGFVNFINDEDGQKAIEALNNTDFMGNIIVVKMSDSK